MTIGIIGFISRDIDIKKAYNSKVEKIGGKAYYEGVALSRIGIPTRVMFYTDNNSEEMIKTMALPNLELHNLISKETPMIENTYADKDLEIRKWRIKNNDFRYTEEMIDDEMKKCDYILICPLNPREITIDLLEYLKENTHAKLAGDLDFYISDVKENGEVIKMDNKSLDNLLYSLDIVIISKKDRIVEGSDEDILRYIADRGVKEVIMTQGSKGALIYSKEEDKIYDIPAVKPKKIIDTTGAGDTFFAGYVASRHNGKNIEEAGNFASKVASAKLENVGALNKKFNI